MRKRLGTAEPDARGRQLDGLGLIAHDAHVLFGQQHVAVGRLDADLHFGQQHDAIGPANSDVFDNAERDALRRVDAHMVGTDVNLNYGRTVALLVGSTNDVHHGRAFALLVRSSVDDYLGRAVALVVGPAVDLAVIGRYAIAYFARECLGRRRARLGLGRAHDEGVTLHVAVLLASRLDELLVRPERHEVSRADLFSVGVGLAVSERLHECDAHRLAALVGLAARVVVVNGLALGERGCVIVIVAER